MGQSVAAQTDPGGSALPVLQSALIRYDLLDISLVEYNDLSGNRRDPRQPLITC